MVSRSVGLPAGPSQPGVRRRPHPAKDRANSARSEGEARLRAAIRAESQARERLATATNRSGRLFALEEELARTERALEEVAEVATRRLPALADLPVQSSWWGWYDVSPDWNALCGETAEPSRFLYATGFSGHGFQQAPAVGEHLAELVVGREPTLDLSPFSAERFARGATRPEAFTV